MVGRFSSGLPPGFRFHPTDEELIIYYLSNQASSKPCPVSIIPEVDIYKFDPWQLPDKAEFGENEWYFFTPRDRKYPNGVRPNRAAVSGYWKATGTDKAIYSGSKYVGVKKALVFYKGKPPKGIKTDWIMHEYRLGESRSQPYKQNGSMRLDDWVLCRIYKKKNVARSLDHHLIKVEAADSFGQIVGASDHGHDNEQQQQQQQQQQYMKFPRTYSLTHLWEFDYMASISQLMNDNSSSSYNVPFNNNQETSSNVNGGFSHVGEKDDQLGHEVVLQQPPSTDANKSQVNQTIFVNPSYGLMQ